MTKLKIRLPLRKVWLLTPVVALLFLCLAFVLTTVNHKQHNATGINEQINFQGRLLTSTGAVVPDGTYNIRFKIYQDGDGVLGGGDESLKWTETRESGNKVTVKNGYFSVYLGSVTALSGIDWNQSVLWLSIDIGGTGTPTYDGEMSPFTRLGSTPYALNAKQLGGIASTGYVQIGPSAAQGDASTNNSIFINKTTGTGNILELQKSGTDVFNIANNGAIVSTYSSTSATAGTEIAHTINATDTGAVTTGSDDTRGLYVNTSRTGASASAVTTLYGVYGLAVGDTGGTSTIVGVEGVAGGGDSNYGVAGAGVTTGSAILSETNGLVGSITSAGFTGTATAVNAIQGAIDISTAGTYGTATGLLIKTTTASGGGAITNNYGAWIQTQTAGGSDYGLRVDTADTQTLWVAGNDASATTAAKGIAFGSARDVTLYRGGANILQTDGDLYFNTGGTRTIAVATSTTGAGNTLALLGASGLASGNNNGGAITLTGGTGGVSSGVGQGGAGGAITITGGNINSSDWQGNAGGAVTIAGGSPVASVAATNATGGALSLSSGTGGSATGFASSAGGAGGTLSITSGGGGTAAGGGNQSGGNAGSLSITAGNGGTSIGTAANSNGGSITLQGGSAGTGGSGAAGTAGNISLQVATGATINVGANGIANTVQIGNTSGAVTQTINIGNNSTASSTNNVNIGSSIAGTVAITGPTTVTGRTSGSSTALQVNNSSSTGSILVLQDNGSAVVTVADGGAVGIGTATYGTNNKLIVNPYITANNAAAAQITTVNDSDKALVLQAHSATQTANLQEWQKSDGTVIANIRGYGVQAAYLELKGVASEGNGSGINFYSNAGTYTGIFSLDGSGNMVFRNNNSGSGMYFDYNSGGAFWRQGGGSTTVFSLGSAGAALFQNSTNSAAAVQIKDSGSEVLFTADTTTRGAGGGNLLKVGNSTGTDGSTTMFQLDSATADPTSNLAALNGSLFYNSSSNKVKIIENGTIKTLCNLTDAGCGAGGSTTLQTAYNNSSSPADITLADGKNLSITAADTTTDPNVLINLQCVTSCSTNGRFAVQSAGTDVFTIAPTGNITATKHLAFGASGAVQTNTVLYTQETSTLTSGAFKGQENQVYMNAASNSSAVAAAADLNLTVQGTAINYTGTQYGVTGTTNVDTTGTVTTTMGLQGISNLRGNGTITGGYGTSGLVYNTSSSGTIGTAAGLGAAIAITSTGTITTAEGLYVNSASAGSGTITTNYGGWIATQTAGASDYGLRVDTADTQTLWVAGNDASATTAAKGIAFGSSRDTNLYRSAANTLKTDNSLTVGTNLAVTGTSTLTGHIAVGSGATINDCPNLSPCEAVVDTQETFTDLSTTNKIGNYTHIKLDPTADNSASNVAGGFIAEIKSGNTKNFSGFFPLVGSYTGAVQNGNGNVNSTIGTIAQVQNNGSGTVSNALGVYATIGGTGAITTGAAFQAALSYGSGAVTDSYGLNIGATSGSAVTNNYGIYVAPETVGTTSNYGIVIGTAGTQTLLLGNDADGTAANGGIAFGQTAGTRANLYRGADNQLKTDSQLVVQPTTNSTTALAVKNASGVVLAAVDTSSTNPSNLVTNPSFEANTTGWTARTGCTLSQDTSNGYNGTASGLCTNTATTNAGMNYGVSLSSTTTYNLVIYVKGNSSYAGFSTLEIGRADNGSTDTSCLTAQTVANNGWTRFVCSFRTGTVSGSPYIYIKQTDATARNWYVDAVVLQTQANADGNLYRDGKLQLNGSIVSPVNIQVSDNSSTAFTVNNSAGGQVFGIDTTDANQVTNPSFEVNTTGWAVKGSSSISRSTAQQNYGNASLLVSTTAAANDGAQYTLPVAVPVGQQVTLSGYVKLGATAFGSGTLVGGYVNGSGDNNCTLAPAVTSTVPTTSGWTRFSCTFTVASTQATAIYFKQTDATSRSFYIDAVQLENGATASPYGLGKFFISGEIVNPVSLKNLNNSTTAFQVFDTSNNQIFGVDTLNAGVNVATGTSINASNYGVSFTASDTNPTCNSGEYKIYADLSETKLKKCQNGTTSDVGAGDKYETFTGNGTYTKPSDAIMVIVQLWGSGGGGGGGAGGTNAAARTGGGGGGGGAFVSQNFLASNLGSSVSVTIGTGGTAGTAGSNAVGGNGGAGNPSCFSTSASCGGTMILRAYGGGGGAGAGAAGNGGGAGGGSLAVGGSSTTATGATGGSPLGAAAGAVNSGGGGAGGATAAATAAAGGASYFGGAGGGASTTAGANNSGAGGGGTFGGSGGGGGGSCAITTCTARTGGAGGANNNISGGGGAAGNGAAGGTGADGTGTGGAGGGGGGSSATVAGWNGGAGGAQGGGGGGGGAAHTGSTVGGAGAAGGRGEARIYSIRGSAADLAEIYGSYQKDIKPGELVCIDPNMRAGVKRCESKYSADAIGVVTTTPSIVIGNVEDPGAVAVPVVLSGRTPVLVSTENGPIAAGDLLTPSSTPGVAMKATKAGQIVGQAMGPYTSEGVGMTVAFIKSGKSLGTTSTIAQNLNINTYDSAEYGKDMLNYLINEQTSIADATNASEIFTDRLTAAIQVVTPELIAKNISTDSISSATGKDVNVKLKADGSLTVQDETGTKTSSIDDKGNATFTGTVKADKIIANQIEGIEIYTDNLLSLAQKQQSTSGVATAQSTSPPKTLTLDSFTSKTGVFEQDVTVTGNLKAVAGLHVDGPAEFMANSTFYKVALFIDKAIFRQNVEFDSDIAVKGDSTFSGNLNVGENTAGRAVIPAGQTTVTIVFKKPYNDVPIVNLTPVGATNLRYAVVDPQKDKFDIQIDSAQASDTTINWFVINIAQ